jgi:predicted DNA-binding protein (MmcQ/YjbR family)
MKPGHPFSARGAQKYRKLFLSKPGVMETFPFGPRVAVYKTKKGKMFATLAPDGESWSGNLKCDPHWALTLRKQYPGLIEPGYHMNKRHWNTVSLDGSLPDRLVREMLDLSYALASSAIPEK